ncbi:MAG: hypothetical protein HYX32_09270 [Actinobacteria bacterium]|nr:hypothetical protein [Actinomycetota bacterium]
MPRFVVLPHQTADSLVHAGPWTAVVNGVAHEAARRLPGWDRWTPIELGCEVTVDPDEVRAAAGLAVGVPLDLIATWRASATGLRGLGARLQLDSSGVHRLGFVVDPSLVGGRLVVSRCLVLGAPSRGGEPLSARRAGSIVWREPASATNSILLGDAEHRFPTDAVDFSAESGIDADAAWWLRVDLDDLSAPPSRALRLLVNTDHPTVDCLLRGSLGERAWMVQSVLQWDVGRALIERAMDEPQFVARFGTFGDDTVGGALQQLYERWLPGTTPARLRALRRDHPDRFDAELQDRLHLLREP